VRHKTNLGKGLTYKKIENKKIDSPFNGLYIDLKISKVIDGMEPYPRNQDQKGQRRDRKIKNKQYGNY
jgi:hypothetical protein